MVPPDVADVMAGARPSPIVPAPSFRSPWMVVIAAVVRVPGAAPKPVSLTPGGISTILFTVLGLGTTSAIGKLAGEVSQLPQSTVRGN